MLLKSVTNHSAILFIEFAENKSKFMVVVSLYIRLRTKKYYFLQFMIYCLH